MPRPIVLSNNDLHVCLDMHAQVSDFYFPYVGLENHTLGDTTKHRVGVRVDGETSWLSSGDWSFKFQFHKDALIGHTTATNKNIGIMLEFDDAVDAGLNAFERTIHVINMRPEQRDVKLFLHQAFIIGDSGSSTDTAQVLPNDHAIVHYRGRRAFVISGRILNGNFFDQYAVGTFGKDGKEGTYRDADDGELSMSSAEHGRVDSTIRLSFTLPAHSSTRANYWVACGTSLREALFVHKNIVSQAVQKRLSETEKWWSDWLRPAKKVVRHIDTKYKDDFIRSVMLIKSHIDKRGAVIASTDGESLNYERDAYAYCWPRDSVYALWPLIRMGYTDEAYNFFDFCRRALSSKGYLAHKYRADGATGSSWHSYIHEDGTVSAPIQEDETASVLFLFSQFYKITDDDAILQRFYVPMIVPMANFLSDYIDKRTHLPKPSYDLWEEHFIVSAYTTTVVQAALYAAAELADKKHDEINAVAWRAVADDMNNAAKKLLYDKKRKVMYKGLIRDSNMKYTADQAIDLSGIYGSFIYGLFGANEKKMNEVVQSTLKALDFTEKEPGLPRYSGDLYKKQSDKSNFWPIGSLWIAQYYLEQQHDNKAKKIVDWVLEKCSYNGIIGEQINPKSGKNTSVAPLAWSQAELVSTLLDMAVKK